MYDFLDKIGLKAVLEAIKGKMSEYASKALYGDTTINVGRKANTTVGNYSTAEGHDTTASGLYAHSEGHDTVASGDYGSHSEGEWTNAVGACSHAEGNRSKAIGDLSHAEGAYTKANGRASHTEGYYTTANNEAESACGKFNISSSGTLFSIGDGTADDARHNAFEITATGGKLHDKDIATTDLIPTTLPANGGNADTLDGHPADYFAKYDNPSIEGAISLVRSGNVTTAGSVFAWEDTLRLRNQDLNAENTTYTDLLLTPSGIFTEGVSNGNYISRKEISTTPIKSTPYSSTTDDDSICRLWGSSENKIPIAVILTDMLATIFYSSLNFYAFTVQQPDTHIYKPNIQVSGTVYYIEV